MRKLKTLSLITFFLFSQLSFSAEKTKGRTSWKKQTCYGIAFVAGTLLATGSLMTVQHANWVTNKPQLQPSLWETEEGMRCPITGRIVSFKTDMSTALRSHVAAFAGNAHMITPKSAAAYSVAMGFTPAEHANHLGGTLEGATFLTTGSWKKEVPVEKVNRINHHHRTGAFGEDGRFNYQPWKNAEVAIFPYGAHECEKETFLKNMKLHNQDRTLKEGTLLWNILHRIGITEKINLGEFEAFFEFFKETRKPGGPFVITLGTFQEFDQFAQISYKRMKEHLDPKTPARHGGRKLIHGKIIENSKGELVFKLHEEVKLSHPSPYIQTTITAHTGSYLPIQGDVSSFPLEKDLAVTVTLEGIDAIEIRELHGELDLSHLSDNTIAGTLVAEVL